MIRRDCNNTVNDSNHPIQNPLLLVTETPTRKNTDINSINDLIIANNNIYLKIEIFRYISMCT
jgi:hypothetical protein